MQSYWLVILEADDEIWAVVQTETNVTGAAVSAAADLAISIEHSVSFNRAIGPFKTKVEALQEYNFRFDGATEFTVQYEVHLLNEPIDLEQISYPAEVEAMIVKIDDLDQRAAALTEKSNLECSFEKQQALDIAIDYIERKVGAIRESLHQRNRVEVVNG